MNSDPTTNASGVASHDLLAPFVAVVKGIPDNWPGECILRFDQRNDGSIYLSYHGINEASHGITINQWRALLGSNSILSKPESHHNNDHDTPETDALHAEHRGAVIWPDFARKLERERNEARAMARDMRNQLEKASPARLLFPWENAQCPSTGANE